MRDLIEALVVISALLGILFLSLGGRRSDRAGHRDPINRLGGPSGDFAVYLLGALAVGDLLAAVPSQGRTGYEGVVFALVVTPLIGMRLTQAVLGVCGVLAGLLAAFQYLTAPTGPEAAETMVFRISLVSCLLAFFVLGSILGVRSGSRSMSTFSFGKGRGLAFYGLVDTFVFFASPGGVDLLEFSAARFFVFLGVAASTALVLGLLAGQFTLYVAAATVALTNVALPLMGLASGAQSAYRTGFAISALVLFPVVRLVVRRFGVRTG